MAWKSSRRSGRDESGEIPTPTAAELRRLPVDERIRVLREVRMAQKAARDVRDAERGIPEPYEPEDENSYEAGRTLDRLLSSDTAAAEEWLSENRAIINDADAQALGIADVLEAYDGEVDNSKPSIWERVGGAAGEAIGLIARPGQVGAELTQEVVGNNPLFQFFGSENADARTPEQKEADGGYADVWKAIRGAPRLNPVTGQQDEYIPLFTLLGHERPEGASGAAYDVGQFAAESAVDPLSYLSGGTKAAARPALEAGAAMLAREAGEGGLKSAAPLLARRLGDDLSESALLRGLQDTGVRGLTREGRTAVAGDVGRRAYNAARRYDRGGLRVGIGSRRGLGRSIIPRSSFRRAGEATRLLDKTRYAPVEHLEGRLLSDAEGTAEGLREVVDQDALDALMSDATGLSYRWDDLGARQGADSLSAFDANRVRQALADRDMDALADALTNPAGRRPPGAPDLGTRAADLAAQIREVGVGNAKADDISRAVASGDTSLVSRIAPGAGSAENRIIEERIPGLFSGARRSRPFAALERAFEPRARIRQSGTLSPGTDEGLYEVQSEARAFGHQETERAVRNLTNGSKGVDDSQRDVIRNIIDINHDGDLSLLDDAGRFGLKVIQDENAKTRQILLDMGIPESQLRDLDDYFPRMPNPKGVRVLDQGLLEGTVDTRMLEEIGFTFGADGKLVGRPTDILGATGQQGHLKMRGVNLSVDEINDVFKSATNKNVNLYEPDPFLATARRAHAANRAASTAKLFDDASEKVRAPDGGALVMRVRPDAGEDALSAAATDASNRGLVRLDTADGSAVFVHKDLVPDMENAVRIVGDDEAIRGFARFMDKWGSIWRGSAINPLVGGTLPRNVTGNIWSNYVRGITNPLDYAKALDIQQAVARAIRKHPDMEIPDALRAIGRSDEDVLLAREVLEDGVLRDGFATSDLPQRTLKPMTNRSIPRKVGTALNPVSPDGLFQRSGSGMTAIFEDNARLAHYIAQRKSGGRQFATRSVKDTLFDYHDLTAFEKQIKRWAIPFYTFMRKNVPLQIRNIAENPGRVARAERFGRMLLGSEEQVGDETAFGTSPTSLGGTQIPGWGPKRGGLLPTDGWQSFGTSNPAFGRVESPFVSAVESLEPLIFAADMARTPTVQGFDTLNPYYTAGNDDDGGTSSRELAGSVLNLPGGGPAELSNILVEEVTGRNLYTGGSIYDRESGERKKNIWLRLSQAVAPALDRAAGVTNFDDRASENTSTRVWEALTGFQIRQINEEDSDTERRRRIEALSDALEAYNKANPDNEAPTVEELQDIGLVPNPEQDARDAAAAREEGRGGRRRRSGW
jgi:hypothetical protein